jgi:hypothetical protein
MAFLMVSAPEAKIFQPHLQESLLEDPSKIFTMDKSEIFVQRPSGRIRFLLGQPHIFASKKSSDGEEDSVYLLHWLTGGSDGMQNQETECYGVVDLGLEDQIVAEVTQSIQEAAISGGDVQHVPEWMQKKIRDARAVAEHLSRARVLRAVRRVWDQMQRQLEINTEGGFGKFKPSKTEILCQYILKGEIAKERARQERIDRDLRETVADGKGLLGTMLDPMTKTDEEPVKRRGRPRKQAEETDGVSNDECGTI